MKDHDDEDIVSIILAGEVHVRFNASVKLIDNKARSIARFRGIPDHDIDDIVTTARQKAIEKLPTLKNRDGFKCWFNTIVMRCCMDHHRRTKRERKVFDRSVPTLTRNDGRGPPAIDERPGIPPDLVRQLHMSRQLELVLGAMDETIARYAALRRHPERDAEIARMGLRDLLAPKEIQTEIAERFHDVSLNAVRQVLFAFRRVLRTELGIDLSED